MIWWPRPVYEVLPYVSTAVAVVCVSQLDNLPLTIFGALLLVTNLLVLKARKDYRKHVSRRPVF